MYMDGVQLRRIKGLQSVRVWGVRDWIARKHGPRELDMGSSGELTRGSRWKLAVFGTVAAVQERRRDALPRPQPRRGTV